ncbi:MAG: RnfABCDGE type electron transport complex subunit B [Oscillospiraceae bacterium]|jgi:electron transport complex protein RnfB|nr:RnfABCDGE type electron transport complex subunit B [Oscillospiraceae bacterium]
MDTHAILSAVLIVCIIGLICGVVLVVASTFMAVPKDQKEEDIRALLPGANCGACGFSGCDGYAAAMAKGEAQPGLCAPGGAAVAKAISDYLGVGGGNIEEKVACVQCFGNNDNTVNKVNYEGIDRCSAANLVAGGSASCSYGCLGVGDCVRACQYGAISVCNGAAVVDTTRCVGCTMCSKVCPRHLITMVPKKRQAVNHCMNCDKGADTNKVCKVGCIGCGKCVKVCPKEAITIENFRAKVDPEKCVGCGLCTKECPRHCLTLMLVPKKAAPVAKS